MVVYMYIVPGEGDGYGYVVFSEGGDCSDGLVMK